MNPDIERHIERFVRNPSDLSEELRREIERLIEEDPGARWYSEFLRDFYDRLDKEPQAPTSDRVATFVDDLFREEEENTVVRLHPFETRREARPTVLAAETDVAEARASSDERRFSILTTLAAEPEDLLVRVVKDRDTGRGCLYVLSDPPERQAHVVVSFPEFDLNLVADEEGRRAFDVPPEVSPEQWAKAQAVVRRPVATRVLQPKEEVAVPLTGGGTLVGDRQEKRLNVELEAKEGNALSLLTVTPPDRSPRLFRLDGSELEYDAPPEAPLVLRVYE